MITELQLPLSLRARLEQGHPWVYRDHVPQQLSLPSGAWLRLRCGPLRLIGLWDAESPIAIRIFGQGDDPPDSDWLAEQVWAAWELREPLRAGPTNAYRWIYGEGDGLPGVVVDRYGDYALMRAYGAGPASLLGPIARALRSTDPELRGVLVRSEGGALQPLWGELPPPDLVVQESGLYFHADLAHGQKTGLFLDQRENRRTVEQYAAGREVLNCFAYTGGFSLYALRGGASHVVSVDIGQGLADAAAANLALNHLDPACHEFVTADCFDLIERYRSAGRQFDLVILDPPSFAKNRQNQANAQRAYTRLNRAALALVRPGGLLVSASCTSQIGPEAFRAMLGEAAGRANRWLQIIHEAGHPLDHPVPAGFPEGRYLKFIVARAR